VSKSRSASSTPKDIKLFFAIVTTLTLLTTGVVIFAPSPGRQAAHGIEPDRPRTLVDFTLTERGGCTVTRADLAGKFLVVNFVHSSCSVSCGIVNQRMAEIQRLTTAQPEVQLVSLTVDPRTDTPPVLAEFGAKFGADPNRWWLLTGEKSGLYGLIETSFLRRDPLVHDLNMPGGFLGTERIALVDAQGRTRKYFDGMKATAPAAVLAALAELRKEKTP
jgi:protein SCO1